MLCWWKEKKRCKSGCKLVWLFAHWKMNTDFYQWSRNECKCAAGNDSCCETEVSCRGPPQQAAVGRPGRRRPLRGSCPCLAAGAASLCQSTAPSDQVGNDFLEGVQQDEAIRQGNKGPPTAWSGSGCGPFIAREKPQRWPSLFRSWATKKKGSVTKSMID